MSRIDEIAKTRTAEELYQMGKDCRDGNKEKGFAYSIPDPETAEKYFEKAAEKGHIEAQYDLARLYETFNGEIYIKKAIEWYEAAASWGHEGAKKALERLEGVDGDDRTTEKEI